MRKILFLLVATAGLGLAACSDSGTDQTQTQSIDRGSDPAMQEQVPAAKPEQSDQMDGNSQPAAPAN